MPDTQTLCANKAGGEKLTYSPQIRRRSLLDHPFYTRWVAGELSLGELQEYARQYLHVVVALPKWLRRAAIGARNAELIDHAIEEEGHVELWLKFAAALGLPALSLSAPTPNLETAALLRDGDRFSREPAGAAVSWAIELQAAAVSEQKLHGLAAWYGIEAHSGGDYFDLHRTLDLAHAAELEALVNTFDPDTKARSQHIAEVMTEHQWQLLSSVESSLTSLTLAG